MHPDVKSGSNRMLQRLDPKVKGTPAEAAHPRHGRHPLPASGGPGRLG
jgi:hypothetical protein